MSLVEGQNVEVLRPSLLKGRVALVTGAGSGIGRAIALRLAALGADVTGVGRRVEALDDTRSLAEPLEGRFVGRPCDLRDSSAIEAIIEEVGAPRGIDLLVNNAGGQDRKSTRLNSSH